MGLNSDEKICKVCGKMFILFDVANYAYKIARINGAHDWYCGYSHFRIGQKEHEARIKKSRERKSRV